MWRGICNFAVRKENKGMRLQSKEIQTIIQIAKDIYGETVQIQRESYCNSACPCPHENPKKRKTKADKTPKTYWCEVAGKNA